MDVAMTTAHSLDNVALGGLAVISRLIGCGGGERTSLWHPMEIDGYAMRWT